MSRKVNQSGRNREGRHVRLYHYVLDSPAWRMLTAAERAIYVDLAKRYDGRNNGRIVYSIREAASELSIGKTKAAEALLRLQQLGFVEITRKGFFHGAAKVASEFRLTEHCCDVTGSPATKDFARVSLEKFSPVRSQVRTVRSQVQDSPPTGTGEVIRRRYST